MRDNNRIECIRGTPREYDEDERGDHRAKNVRCDKPGNEEDVGNYTVERCL